MTTGVTSTRSIPISRPSIGAAERAAVLEVLDSGMLVQGPRTRLLEERFAAECGVRHAVATSSGTTALHLALLANGIGPGDEVITSSFTFIATANAILMAGATPVFADVDAETFNLDPEAVARAVTPRTRAVLPVHLYGQMCDMDALGSLAAAHGLVLLEDAAQAVGATYRGRAAGAFGTGAFSLYATKNLAAGEGGMITTDDDEVADRARLLRSHGMRERYRHEMLGFNYRMTDLHAAIALAQFDRLDAMNQRRADNAAVLSSGITSLAVPVASVPGRHVWHQYTVRVRPGQDRGELVAALAAAGVGTGVFYPIPAHRQPHLAGLAPDAGLPVTEELAATVLSLPVHPELSAQDLETIVTEVNRL